MTELSALNVRITGDASDLQAALSQTNAALAQTGTVAQAAQARATGLTRGLGALGNISSQTRSRIQNTAFQLQDLSVQLASGTSASVAFSQQLPQLLGGFGALGAIAGVLAGVGIPVLAAAFASGGNSASAMGASLNALQDRVAETRAAISGLANSELRNLFGTLTADIRALAESGAEVSLRRQVDAARDLVGEFSALYGPSGFFNRSRREELYAAFGSMAGQVNEVAAAVDRMRRATNLQDQVNEASRLRAMLEAAFGSVENMTAEQLQYYAALVDSETALRQALSVANQLASATESGADAAARLANEYSRALSNISAANAAAAATGSGRGGDPRDFMGGRNGESPGRFRYTGPQLVQDAAGNWVPVSATRGGGGARSNPVETQLTSLRNSLMTQEEAQIASYERQQETLRLALEQRLLTQQEYQAMMEAAQTQHGERMAQLDAYRYGSGLQQAETFFGDMAGALSSGNDAMMRASRSFAAAEALINAWRAYSQTIADPSLPWFAKLAAGAKVLGAGMAAVNAIKGGGGSGGGAASVASAASVQSAQPLQATLNLQGPFAQALSGALSPLLDGLAKEAGDRGYILLTRAS